MKTPFFAWAGLFAALAFGLAIGCGRSHVYPFEAVAESSTGGSGGVAGTSGGRGTSGGGTTGRATSAGSTGLASASSGTGVSGASGSNGGGPSGNTGTTGASGATSGLTSGLTSAGSSGGSSGGCLQGAPPNQFEPCQAEQNCSCPLLCVPGPFGQNLCETPCETLSDCPILYTVCQGGTCQPNLCGGLAGPPNGTLDGTCKVVGENDGSCVPMNFGAATVGLCYQGGGTIQSCDPSAQRPILTDACAPDLVCLPVGGSGECETLCNPALPTTCPGEGPCVEPLSSDPDLGVCEPGATTGASSGGSTGGSSDGGTAGGTTGGFTGGSSGGNNGGSTGCPSPVPPSEFSACQTQDDCGCPLECAFDAWAGGRVCEYPCRTLDDCPNVVTICTSQGVCQVDPCGQGTSNGTFDSTCNVVGTNDGTCLPLTNDGGMSIGYCYQGGSGSADCDPEGPRNDLSRVCPVGSICFGGAVGFGGTCNVICDPNQGGGCPGNQFCSFIVNEPDLGICISNSGD